MRHPLLLLLCSMSCALGAQDEGKMLRLSYQISSIDAEVRSLKDAIENQQTRLESMREEVSQLIHATKDATGEQASSLEARLGKIEKNFDKIVSDIKQLSTFSNELASYQKKLEKALSSYDSLFEAQEKEIKNVNAALKSIVQAVQKTEGLPKLSSGSYRVKSGDTLEKIAKEFGISLGSLKEMNNLQTDTIFVGQQLQITK